MLHHHRLGSTVWASSLLAWRASSPVWKRRLVCRLHVTHQRSPRRPTVVHHFGVPGGWNHWGSSCGWHTLHWCWSDSSGTRYHGFHWSSISYRRTQRTVLLCTGGSPHLHIYIITIHTLCGNTLLHLHPLLCILYRNRAQTYMCSQGRGMVLVSMDWNSSWGPISS